MVSNLYITLACISRIDCAYFVFLNTYTISQNQNWKKLRNSWKTIKTRLVYVKIILNLTKNPKFDYFLNATFCYNLIFRALGVLRLQRIPMYSWNFDAKIVRFWSIFWPWNILLSLVNVNAQDKGSPMQHHWLYLSSTRSISTGWLL